MPVPVVLAVDIGTIMAVAFLIITFLGWVMNGNNEKKPPARPKQPRRQNPPPRAGRARPPQRKGRVQSEIDVFLQEVSGRRGEQSEDSGRRPTPVTVFEDDEPDDRRGGSSSDRDLAELRRKRQRRERDESRRREELQRKERQEEERIRKEREAKKRERQERAERSRTGGGGSERQPARSQGGENPLEALNAQYREQEKSPPSEALSAYATEPDAEPHPIAKMLQDPSQVKNAILLNEILSPPKGMRPRK